MTSGENELPSQREVFRTMQTLLEGIAQVAENHGFKRGDDLMVWFAKNLPHADRRKDGLGTVSVKPVTRGDAIAFLETACRNWSKVPRLSEEDIGDVATELLRFATARVKSCLTSIGVEAGK